jgi:hypothetical protein
MFELFCLTYCITGRGRVEDMGSRFREEYNITSDP